MAYSVVLTAVLVAILRALHRIAWSDRRATPPMAPLAFSICLACSLAQYENQLYGLMVVHYFTAVGGVAALYLLGQRPWWSLALATVAAAVAASSVASGLLVFPLGIVVLAAQRAAAWRWSVWCTAGAVTTALCLHHYDRPPHTLPFEWTPVGAFKIVKLGLCSTGAPLAAGSVYWALVLGAAAWVLALVLLYRWLVAAPSRRAADSSAAAILLLGLGSCAMVGLGRAFLVAPGDPVGSRYITHANLAWYGILLLLPRLAGTRLFGGLKPALFGLLALGLLAANAYGARAARGWHRDRLVDQYVMQSYRAQTDRVLGRLGPPEIVRGRLDYLRQERLSAFAEPQRLLLALDLDAGRPTEAVVAGRSIEERLACPVEDLHDVGVYLLPAARPGPGTIEVLVAGGGRELAAKSFAVADIDREGWFRLPLPHPWRCRDRELTFLLRSSADAGSGVSALAMAPFHRGRLRQGAVELAGRRLAIALNAGRYRVYDAAPGRTAGSRQAAGG